MALLRTVLSGLVIQKVAGVSVCGEQRGRGTSEHSKIAFYQIVSLNSILYEVGVPHHIVGNIVLNAEVVHTVYGESSIV